MNAVMFIIISF